MTLKDDLTDYHPSSNPSVLQVDGDHITVFLADEEAAPGTALGFRLGDEVLFGVVDQRLGTRRVRVWFPGPSDRISGDTPVEITNLPAAFALPEDRTLDLKRHLLRPARSDDLFIWPDPPSLFELSGQRRALSIGVEPLDLLAPICRGGLTLVIDTTDDERAFQAIAQRVAISAAPDHFLLHTSTDLDANLDGDLFSPAFNTTGAKTPALEIFALQLIIATASHLRSKGSTLAIIDLPQLGDYIGRAQAPQTPPTGLAQIIDRLGRHLVSTRSGEFTTLLRLRLHAKHQGLATIIDTLHLGDVDALIFIDPEGRFRPTRSTSRADLDPHSSEQRQGLLQTLHLAHRAQDKRAIFGDQDLTAEERSALRHGPSLCPSLIDL